MAKCRYYKMCWLRLGYDCDELNSDCRDGGYEGCKRFELMPNVKALREIADELDIVKRPCFTDDGADICFKSSGGKAGKEARR